MLCSRAGSVRTTTACRCSSENPTGRRCWRCVARGDARFFLGTDSAPHSRHAKEAACGCAGIFSAHAGIELYAEVFEQLGALAELEDFASSFGADFYRLPRNQGTLTLERRAWTRAGEPTPSDPRNWCRFRAGESVAWALRP